MSRRPRVHCRAILMEGDVDETTRLLLPSHARHYSFHSYFGRGWPIGCLTPSESTWSPTDDVIIYRNTISCRCCCCRFHSVSRVEARGTKKSSGTTPRLWMFREYFLMCCCCRENNEWSWWRRYYQRPRPDLWVERGQTTLWRLKKALKNKGNRPDDFTQWNRISLGILPKHHT